MNRFLLIIAIAAFPLVPAVPTFAGGHGSSSFSFRSQSFSGHRPQVQVFNGVVFVDGVPVGHANQQQHHGNANVFFGRAQSHHNNGNNGATVFVGPLGGTRTVFPNGQTVRRGPFGRIRGR